MVDAQRLMNAILSSRGVTRPPNDQELGMVHVALSGDAPPGTLSALLAALDDTSRFDFSTEFGLAGHLLNAVQDVGDQELDAFVERWSPAGS